MKNLSYLFSVLMLAFVFNFTACKDDPTPPIVDPGTGGEELEVPGVDAPGAGKVTLVLHVPDGTCNGIVAVGSNGTDELAWTPAGTDFTAVENAEDWYQVTLTYAADMIVKVIAKMENGEVSWNTQWGMNVEGENANVIFATSNEGCTIDNSENKGEVKLTSFAESAVIYIDVKAWKSEPCVERNQAGTATFKVTVPASTPATAVVSIAGGWEGDESWAPGKVVMTNNGDGTYSLTKDVPANFQYKYVVSADGETWKWDFQYNKQFDMPLSLTANDVVEAWDKEPWNTEKIPGGTGTFIVTITSGYVDGSDIIFTGNFAEKAWGDSDRVMTKEGDTWKWEGAYPDNFEAKVIMRKEGSEDKWANGDNQPFDGTNYSFEFAF